MAQSMVLRANTKSEQDIKSVKGGMLDEGSEDDNDLNRDSPIKILEDKNDIKIDLGDPKVAYGSKKENRTAMAPETRPSVHSNISLPVVTHVPMSISPMKVKTLPLGE